MSGQPNTTQTPNEIFDEYLERFNEAELKIILVVIRKTFGLYVSGDRWTTISELLDKTGVRSNKTISKALQSLIINKFLEAIGEDGTILDTPYKRRAYSGKIYYRYCLDAQQICLPMQNLHSQPKKSADTRSITSVILNAKPTKTTKEINPPPALTPNPPIVPPFPSLVPLPDKEKELVVETDFDWKAYLQKMVDSNRKSLRIMAMYAKAKGFYFENKAQVGDELNKMNYVFASQLAEKYSEDKIRKVMIWLRDNASFKWHLGTVVSHINQDLSKITYKKIN